MKAIIAGLPIALSRISLFVIIKGILSLRTVTFILQNVNKNLVKFKLFYNSYINVTLVCRIEGYYLSLDWFF